MLLVVERRKENEWKDWTVRKRVLTRWAVIDSFFFFFCFIIFFFFTSTRSFVTYLLSNGCVIIVVFSSAWGKIITRPRYIGRTVRVWPSIKLLLLSLRMVVVVVVYDITRSTLNYSSGRYISSSPSILLLTNNINGHSDVQLSGSA